MKRKAPHQFQIILSLCVLSVAACSNQPLPQLPPEEIIALSIERVKALHSFHFVIDRSGASAFLDPQETISFSRAEGDYIAPDSVKANVRIVAPALVTEVGVIAIGASQWETNLLTGEWRAVPTELTFNPAVLFNADTGILAALASDLSAPQVLDFQELEELPGLTLYALEARMDGGRVYDITYGMIGPEELQVKLWIEPGSFNLHRILVVEPARGEEDEDTVWQLDFWDFDKDIEITSPLEGGG